MQFEKFRTGREESSQSWESKESYPAWVINLQTEERGSDSKKSEGIDRVWQRKNKGVIWRSEALHKKKKLEVKVCFKIGLKNTKPGGRFSELKR